jgi:hypothetical protein
MRHNWTTFVLRLRPGIQPTAGRSALDPWHRMDVMLWHLHFFVQPPVLGFKWAPEFQKLELVWLEFGMREAEVNRTFIYHFMIYFIYYC